MNTYEKAGTISLIAAVGSLALGLFVAPWFLVLGAALAGAAAALEMAAEEIKSHRVQIICTDVEKEKKWYDEQQYDFMLSKEVN